MADQDPRDGHGWEAGWQGHAQAQRMRTARLPLGEKLRWLEEAQHLLGHLRRGPGRRRGRAPDPGTQR